MNEHECDITKPHQIGRATWVCPVCGRDLSMQYVFYMDAVERDAETMERDPLASKCHDTAKAAQGGMEG